MSQTQSVTEYMLEVGQAARAASRLIAKAHTQQKNNALIAMANAIERDAEHLLAANQRDMDAARAKGLDAAMLDRLKLSAAGVKSMAEGLRQCGWIMFKIRQCSDSARRQ